MKTLIVLKAHYAALRKLKQGESVDVPVHLHGRSPTVDVIAGPKTKPVSCTMRLLDTKADRRKLRLQNCLVRLTRR